MASTSSAKKKKHHLIVSGTSMRWTAGGRNTIKNFQSKVTQADLLVSQVKGFQNVFFLSASSIAVDTASFEVPTIRLCDDKFELLVHP